MKPIAFTLLLSACIGQVGAQQDKPRESAAGARSPALEQPAAAPEQPAAAPEQPAAAPGQPTAAPKQPVAALEPPAANPGDIPCPRCNRDEQLVVDLVYYKQVLDILEEINQQRGRIDAGLLKSVHAELIKIRPDLADLLKTRADPPARPAAPAKKPKQPAKKPAKPKSKPAPKQGIDGLTVGHVNDENRALGIKASVVLVSNGRPRSLAVGSIIEHNRRRFKIIKVDYVEDRGRGNRHEVHLEDQASKQVHVVPWQ